MRDREKHIILLKEELNQKELWLTETRNELRRLDEIYRKEQQEAQEAISSLEKDNKDKTAWAQQIEERYAAQLAERTEWAQRLDRELNETREQLEKIYASLAYRVGKRLGLSPLPRPPQIEPDS